MVYHGWMAYVIFLHLLYLLISILYFEIIRAYYTWSVLLNLIWFMIEIGKTIRKSWHYLHDLMNKLIKKFCLLINGIFLLIKAKLIFYLGAVYTTIAVDYFYLIKDLESMKSLLLELQSEFHKYILVSQSVNQSLKALNKLKDDNKDFKEYIKKLKVDSKIINKLDHKFSYQNHRISQTLKLLSSINLERSIKSKGDKNADLVMNLKMNLENIKEKSSDIIKMRIDKSLAFKFNKSQESIKNILEMIDMADLEVSEEIVFIIRQLYIVETINLVKLNVLISKIKLLHLIILARVYLLVCTILFYQEIQPTINQLNESLKFETCNVCGFLGKCSEFEKYISRVSSSINACIINLATISNKCCIKRIQKLKEVLLNLIGIIMFMKFYVDLMAMEILIFKMIILTLIEMTGISFTLDVLIKLILEITVIDKAIPTLIFVSEYLRTFYFIQLQNTTTIVGLSSKLMFSESIHQHYRVLLLNLQSIKLVIWVLECYINHLIVFKFTSVCLNSLIENIAKQLEIITNIYKVMSSMATIANKLGSIDKSITELKTVGDSVDITNWRESATKIRQETQSINTNVTAINSELANIIRYLSSIYKSFAKLLGIYYYLLVLIAHVLIFIKNTDKRNEMVLGIGNKYYTGVVLSVLGPCNKQLKFILAYLFDMWLCMGNLVKIVQNTMAVIYGKMGWLNGLSKVLQDDVDKINEGVQRVEYMEVKLVNMRININGCYALNSYQLTTPISVLLVT